MFKDLKERLVLMDYMGMSEKKKKGSFKHDLNGNIKAKIFKIKKFQTSSRKHRRISLHS